MGIVLYFKNGVKMSKLFFDVLWQTIIMKQNIFFEILLYNRQESDIKSSKVII